MKTKKLIAEKISSLIYSVSILVFIIAFNFAHNPPSGWQQQYLPDLSGSGIVDITFTDSLTGYAVTDANSDKKSYVMKTSNSGENWIVIKTDSANGNFTKCKFINSETGYVSMLDDRLYKTSNGGINWIRINNPISFSGYKDISVLSENEVWMCFDSPFNGGVYRTTNSGLTWENKYPPQLSNGPIKLYMINSRIGFISNGDNVQSYLKKTTDAGENWFDIIDGTGWININYSDSLTGWKTMLNISCFQKTIDGGISWDTLFRVISGNPTIAVNSFSNISDSIIWGSALSNRYNFSNNQVRAIVLKSINQGKTWSYQIPDTSLKLVNLKTIDFIDTYIGWSYKVSVTGIRTLTGGDSVTYPLTSVYNNNTIIPIEIKLYQNYPNPFNPETKIKYLIVKSGIIKINVYDISGKKIREIVNQRQSAGEYEVIFNAADLPSGVYFYTLTSDGRFAETRKMILIR